MIRRWRWIASTDCLDAIVKDHAIVKDLDRHAIAAAPIVVADRCVG